MWKEMGQPGPEERPAASKEGRVCLGFHISLNHPLKKFTTTLSDLYKRRNQDNPSISRVAKLCWAARKQQPQAACSRDLPQSQEAARVLRLLMGKQGRAKGTTKAPLTRLPISSQHTSLCSTPHISQIPSAAKHRLSLSCRCRSCAVDF